VNFTTDWGCENSKNMIEQVLQFFSQIIIQKVCEKACKSQTNGIVYIIHKSDFYRNF